MVVGTIIGASIFVQPSEVTGRVPSVVGALVVWLAAGALTLMGSLVCAELASIFPRTGGVYVFLREALGRPLGFLWGWAMFWSMHSGIIAAIAVIFGRYTAFFWPLSDAGIRLVAIAVILLLSIVNYLGVRPGTMLQTLFTAGKLGAVAIIIAAGWVLGSRLPAHFVSSADPVAVGAADFLAAVAAGLFAFGGWHMVTYNAEETVDPTRTIPRALVLGTLIVTAAYAAMNLVYLYVLPLDVVAASTRVAADAADAVLGFGGGAFMSAIVMFSTFGALAGIVLAGPRVYYAMARDRLAFQWVGGVHPRFRTPHRAIVLQAMWSSILVATGTFRTLFTRVIYTEWIFFALMALGLIWLRRHGTAGSTRVPGYPLVPALFVAASLGVVLNHVIASPAESAFGLALVAAGLPIYAIWRRFTDADR